MLLDTRGRSRRHGDEFIFGDPATWSEPDTSTLTETRLSGPALIRLEIDRVPAGAISKPVRL